MRSNLCPRFDVMIGPQCAGKTTLAHSLEFSGYKYISLGEQVRNEPPDSATAIEANELINAAKPWPAHLGLAFIKSAILSASLTRKDILLDGYPRHSDELIAIEEFIQGNGVQPISGFIDVIAQQDELLRRYHSRGGRGENDDFYRLRYNQYIAFRSEAREYCDKHGLDYRVIDTTTR